MAKDDNLTLSDGRVNPIKLARMIKANKGKSKEKVKVVPGRVIQGTAITKRRGAIADVPTVRGRAMLKNYVDN